MAEKEISDANILRVAAETNGFQGGDSGHGCRTVIELEDLGGTDIKFVIENDGKMLRIELGGDAELRTVIEALEFATQVLKDGSQSPSK